MASLTAAPQMTQPYLDIEMDRRAKEAVAAAIKKAKVCGKPIAGYDVITGQAYIEYADGTNEYVK